MLTDKQMQDKIHAAYEASGPEKTFHEMSNKSKNIVNLFADMDQNNYLVKAVQIAQIHHITLQFCPKCVHASIGYACVTIKYAHTPDKNKAALLAVEGCLEKYNKLSGDKHV